MRFLRLSLSVLALSVCGFSSAGAATVIRDYGVGTGQGPLATQALSQLSIKGRAPMTGYTRAAFGEAWADTDGNGCDQRDDMLARAAFGSAVRSGCKVESATITDVYTGRVIHYIRGGSYDQGLDIDHVVALGDAWSSGIGYKSAFIRLHIATDPLNLLPVDPSANRTKGDSNAASWLPPRSDYRCSYVARQIAVKKKYGLWITAPEHDAMARVLSHCPSVHIPAGGLTPPTPAQLANTGSTGSSASTTTPIGGGSGKLDPHFSSCAKAKAAGYGPYVRGRDPEYAWYRDGDSDGVACE